MGVRLILKKFLNYADNLSRDYSVFWTGVWSPRLPVGGLPMSEIPRWAAPSAIHHVDVFCAQETMMCLRRNTCSKVVQYVFCRDKSK